MSKNLAVVVIHGMGTHDDKFAKPMIDKLASRLGKAKFDQIAWKPILWSDLALP